MKTFFKHGIFCKCVSQQQCVEIIFLINKTYVLKWHASKNNDQDTVTYNLTINLDFTVG